MPRGSFIDEANIRRLLGQGYDRNNVMGGIDEYGNSLVYHPDHYDPATAGAILVSGVVNVLSMGASVAMEGMVSLWVVDSLATASPVLRWIPQSYARSSLMRSGWQAGKMQERTAARGGWSMQQDQYANIRVQWSAAGGRHGGSYWKVSGPALGTQRIPYFFHTIK